ncbi:hypothetical protein V8E36_006741 [Tilletia maclaganii]
MTVAHVQVVVAAQSVDLHWEKIVDIQDIGPGELLSLVARFENLGPEAVFARLAVYTASVAADCPCPVNISDLMARLPPPPVDANDEMCICRQPSSDFIVQCLVANCIRVHWYHCGCVALRNDNRPPFYICDACKNAAANAGHELICG